MKKNKLIVFLGNPGEKYQFTRHNMGFLCAEGIVKKFDIKLKYEPKHDAIIGGAELNGTDFKVIFPQTFMKLSGRALRSVMNFYKIEAEDILVVYDDVSFEFGRLKFKAKGSDGGHNGLKSIIENLGSEQFYRLKVGIGPISDFLKIESYVLQKFSKEELEKLPEIIDICTGAIETWLCEGFNSAANKFN